MSTRQVPVPDTCSAAFVVLTPDRLDHVDDVPLPDPALLRRHGTSATALERLADCPNPLVLQTSAPTVDAAPALRDTRIRALVLAAEHDGLVLDLSPPRLLEQRPDEVSLAHATQWYVGDPDAVAERAVRTDGLEQFGLPEVVVADVGPERRAMVDAVVAGLVHRLIAEWPGNDPVGPATITLRDIAFGLGDPQAATTPAGRSVDVEIDYDAAAHLLRVTLLQDPAETLFAP
ncbi:MAG: hypothetical protein PGN07_06945 [Aeromicrobium erythreum]